MPCALWNGMTDTKPLLAVCAWCPDAAERTSEAQAHGYDVTHTICHSCSLHVLANMEQAADDFVGELSDTLFGDL